MPSRNEAFCLLDIHSRLFTGSDEISLKPFVLFIKIWITRQRLGEVIFESIRRYARTLRAEFE